MYESRIYIYNRIECEWRLDGNPRIYGDEIARFEMCGMRQGFTDIFTETVDVDIYADDGSTVITEDKYGAPLKQTSIESLILWLEKETQADDYRRLKPLLAFCKAVRAEEWDGELVAVHYGY